MIVHECNGGDVTAESGVGILKVKVKGYNWDMHLFVEGMSACQF
jgi:hypothetical protein